MSYIGNTPGVSSQRVVTEEVISGSPKSAFYPIGGYALGYVDVLVNGLEVDSSDFTAADGVVVTLGTAAAVGDTVKIKCYLPRGLSDGYLKTEADAKFLPKTGGTLTGDLVLDNGSADGAQVILKSLGYSNWNIDNYNGKLRAYYNATEYFNIDASGNLSLLAGNFLHGGPSSNITGAQSLSWKTSPDTTTIYPRLSLAQQTATGADHAWTFRTQGNGTLHLSHSDQFAWNTFTDKLAIDNSGNTTIAGNLVLASGKGIDFSANSNASGMSSELLDDYERGTWTPVPTVTYGTGSITSYSSQGSYIKIGNLVHVKFQITSLAYSGSPVNLGVYGLPFTINAQSENYSGGIAQNLSTGNMYQLEMGNGYSYITVIRRYDNGTAFTNQNVGFDGSATYFV